MLRTLKSLGLGLALIAATSAVLLLSDLDRRGRRTAPSPAAARLPRIAIMQFASSALLDDATAGILAGLLAGGYEDGRTARLRRFNASGDYATANTMARDIAAGGYDLIITASTPALQVMAAANRDGKTVHVFGAVTDPYGSGVGITGPEPGQHPRHLVGIGTFQPVARAFALARQMAPGLRRVGVVWNPTEHNSEVCVKAARAQCRVLGLDLVEATVGNTSEVPEAVRAVLSRNVDALWVGGDTMRWGRLELPALPLLAAVAAVGFDAVLRAFDTPAPRLAGWLAFLPLALAPLLDARDLQDRIAGASPVHEAMWANQYRAGRDLAAWLPAGAWVVGQDMGLMPYTTPELRFIDSVGLVSGEVAEVLARYRITPYGVKVADPVLAEANTELAYAEIRDRIFAHNPAAFILVAHVPTATPALAAAAQSVGPLRAYRGYFGTFARRLDRDPRLEEGFVLVKQYARAADYVLLVFVRKDLAARIPGNR